MFHNPKRDPRALLRGWSYCLQALQTKDRKVSHMQKRIWRQHQHPGLHANSPDGPQVQVRSLWMQSETEPGQDCGAREEVF